MLESDHGRRNSKISSLLAFVAIAGCGAGGASGSGNPIPIASPSQTPTVIDPTSQSALPATNTTWTYQQQISSSSDTFYNGKTGNITITFEGMQTYRGGTYYTLQFKGLQPPVVTNYFTEGPGGTFSEFAGAFYNFSIIPNCQSPQQEDVLASPTSFASVQSMSVMDSEYQCGSVASTSQATVTAADSGTGVANTPGGVFSARIITGTFTAFGQTVQYKDYVAGNTIVERDVQYSDPQHQQATTAVTKYVAGPLDVAFPGLSMLLAQYW